MKTKITCFLLLLCTLLLPVPVARTAYAATDEPSYDSFVDEVAGMEEPQWTLHFNPEFNYKYELGIVGIERLEGYKKWNIVDMYYSFTLNNKHKGEALVGYNPSDLNILFEYEFYSVDDNNVFQTSTSSFVYPLQNYYSDTGDISFSFPYEDILNSCTYYVEGLPTLIHSVKITVVSAFFNTCGTSVIYDFAWQDNDFARQICSGITYYEHTQENGFVYKGDNTAIHQENESSFDLFMFTLPPDSAIDMFVGVLRFMGELIVQLPGMLWNVLSFLFNFFAILPRYLHLLLPFVPIEIINLVMYCIYFSILWGIYLKYKKIKGD